MKKYLSFFRLRFSMGLQYRTAAISAAVTQFLWGAMEIVVFCAFYDANPAAFPMSLEATVSYVWLQQAFLFLFLGWDLEGEILSSIEKGNVVYELCRPVKIYRLWFARTVAYRSAGAALRCIPVVLVALLLPRPFRLELPRDKASFLLFLLTLVLGMLVMTALCMLIYMLSFFTISSQGLRMTFSSATEFLSGGIIPLPFLPGGLKKVVELLPFASMQNVPLRIYSGDLTGMPMWNAIGLQLFWIVALVALGEILGRAAEKKVELQGG